MSGFILTWAGECSAWECDELGHLNMRHYVKKFGQARKGFIIRLGLSHAFLPDTDSSVRVKDIHIRYHGEARPGQALKIETALIELSQSAAKLCHIMYHFDGRIAATVIETLEHIYLHGHRVFKWPDRVHVAADEFMVDMPEAVKPRNVSNDTVHVGRELTELNELGFSHCGTGVFTAAETDVTGRVTIGSLFGRITESITWYHNGWPELQDPDYLGKNHSAALLEARMVIHNYAIPGQAYIFMPAIVGADNYVRRIGQNLVDPVSGQNWATMETAGCKFDLNTRRLMKNSDQDIADLLSRDGAIKDLQI